MEVPLFHFIRFFGDLIVLGANSTLHVFSLRGETKYNASHHDTIRDGQFNADGAWFVTVGDDKKVNVWNVQSWALLSQRTTKKKLTAVAFGSSINDEYYTKGCSNFERGMNIVGVGIKDEETDDTSHGVVVYADKFGDLYFSSLPNLPKQTLLLGHVSTITHMVFTRGGQYLITCDRDEKIRVSHYPRCYEIQSFCLGHTSLVTQLLMVDVDDKEFLVSAGADASLRLWDFMSGQLLSTAHLLPSSTEKGKDNAFIISSVAYCKEHKILAAAVEGQHNIWLYELKSGIDVLELHYCSVLLLQANSVVYDLKFDRDGALWAVGSHPLVQTFVPIMGSPIKYVEAELDAVKKINQNIQQAANVGTLAQALSWRPLLKKDISEYQLHTIDHDKSKKIKQ